MFSRMPAHQERAAGTMIPKLEAPFWNSTVGFAGQLHHVGAQPAATRTNASFITRFHRSFRLAAIAMTGFLVTACADNAGPMAPTKLAAVAAVQASHSNGKTKVLVLKRKTALSRDFLVSADIGVAGGTLQIDKAGVTLVVPPNAVSATTRITMRALAGNAVAYEFEPHGLVFNVALTIKQDLDRTNWKKVSKGNVEGAYYADPASLNRDLGEADVDEFFVTSTKGEKTLSFRIPHFSGYLVSSARR